MADSTAKPAPFVWYELLTTDPEGAAAFYGDVVGWTVSSDADPASGGGVDYRMIVRDDGGNAGGLFGLSKDMTAAGARPCWLGYLYTPDVDATIKAIEADGGAVKMPAVDLPVGRIAMVTDPDGSVFYVMTPIPPAGQPAAINDVYDRRAPQRVSWNELMANDDEAAKAFYSKHFGMAFNDKMAMGAMGDYWFITESTMQDAIGALMRKPPNMPTGGWQYYIRVAGIDAAVEKVNAGGGQVVNGPMEVPGGDWIINGIDPQGAAFSLVGAK
ncbi:MAG: VOC family protein [Novosphingobium sp.]